MRRMTEQQKAERRARAAKLNAEGQEFYEHGDFVNAEKKFKEAVDLDPDAHEYYYKYGVTLYRNQKFNDALVALKLSKVESNQELEKKYYIGLVHYRLAELDNALHQFQEIVKSKDSTLAPSALFYAGVILFEGQQKNTRRLKKDV